VPCHSVGGLSPDISLLNLGLQRYDDHLAQKFPDPLGDAVEHRARPTPNAFSPHASRIIHKIFTIYPELDRAFP
jgi:hypothetical protein